MPVMSDKVTYGNLNIKPPITFRLQFTKDQLVGARGQFGATVGTQTVDNVRWGFEVHVCPEGQPDCTTTQHALTVVLQSDRGNNRWLLTTYFESFYVSPTAQFQYEVFKFGSETDLAIDIVFTDSIVRVVANNKTAIDTDTFKRFEQVRTLKANNYFFDAAGAEVVNFGTQYLSYIATSVKPIELGALVNQILPIAVTIGAVGLVIGTLRQLLPALRR